MRKFQENCVSHFRIWRDSLQTFISQFKPHLQSRVAQVVIKKQLLNVLNAVVVKDHTNEGTVSHTFEGGIVDREGCDKLIGLIALTSD